MPDDDRPGASTDVALLCGPAPQGDGVTILRAREGRVELGVLREMKEGVPLQSAGEVVQLRPRADNPRVCDVTVHHTLANPAQTPVPAGPRTAADGPPQVATETYRQNWERIFGGPPRPAHTLN